MSFFFFDIDRLVESKADAFSFQYMILNKLNFGHKYDGFQIFRFIFTLLSTHIGLGFRESSHLLPCRMWMTDGLKVDLLLRLEPYNHDFPPSNYYRLWDVESKLRLKTVLVFFVQDKTKIHKV